MRTNAAQHAWSGVAAYIYVLELDAVGWAWEYLRRNIAYQRLWRHRYRLAADAVAPWHLAQLEDPGLDARQAHPVWQYPLADQVALHGMRPTPGLALPVFSLWALRGRKQVRALSGGYALQVRQAAERAGLPGLFGDPRRMLVDAVQQPGELGLARIVQYFQSQHVYSHAKALSGSAASVS